MLRLRFVCLLPQSFLLTQLCKTEIQNPTSYRMSFIG
nr:hypothetical protein IXTSGTPV_IXTSGTPV_CDS_0006 [Microvirus sp.]